MRTVKRVYGEEIGRVISSRANDAERVHFYAGIVMACVCNGIEAESKTPEGRFETIVTAEGNLRIDYRDTDHVWHGHEITVTGNTTVSELMNWGWTVVRDCIEAEMNIKNLKELHELIFEADE